MATLLEVELNQSLVTRPRRRGRYRKVVGIGAVRCRELYLRPGENMFVQCAPPSSVRRRCVLLDVGVVPLHLDLLEDAAFEAGQVLVVLQTVLEKEMAELSQREQRRLAALLRGHSGGWDGAYIFFNEHCPETYVKGKYDSTDRVTRAVKSSLGWLQWYLEEGAQDANTWLPRPTLLTIRSEAYLDFSSAVQVLNIKAYIESAVASPSQRRELIAVADAAAAAASHKLAELSLTSAAPALAAGKEGSAATTAIVAGGKEPFAAHMSAAALESGLASCELVSGAIDVFEHNPQEAVVVLKSGQNVAAGGLQHSASTSSSNSVALLSAASSGGERPRVLLTGRSAFNRAMHGDIVAVRLLPPAQWKVPAAARRLMSVPPPEAEAEERTELEGGDAAEADATAAAPNAAAAPPQGALPTGVVVGVLQRMWRPFVATIPLDEDMRRRTAAAAAAENETSVLAVPMDPRLPKVRVRTRQLAHLAGKRLVLAFDDWQQDSQYPSGHYLRVLGPVGDVATEVAALLVEFGADFGPFGAAALACLPDVPRPPQEPQQKQTEAAEEEIAAGDSEDKRSSGNRSFGALFKALPWQESGWRVPSEEAAKRRDLREVCRVFSVDPRGCQDIDDAMHVRHLPDGSLEVGVHIADVTHFLTHGSALDLEARRRATTTYLVHRRFDMLPALLAGDVCSLHGGVERLAFSVIWTLPPAPAKAGGNNSSDFDKAAAGSETFPYQLPPAEHMASGAWFGRTVIKSCAAMTYEQADELLRTGALDSDGSKSPPPPPKGQAGGPVEKALQKPLSEDLWALTRFTRALRQRREAAGALDLSSEGGELKFRLDDATGEPLAVTPKHEAEIHHTIAEMMILANAAVAETIAKTFPTAALLRAHQPPSLERLGALADVALAAGAHRLRGVGGKELEAALVAISGGGGNGRAGGSGGQSGGESPAVALAKSIAVRAMSEARYVSTGDTLDRQAGGSGGAMGLNDGNGVEEGRFGHYGLHLRYYTHFTSPIRRYADIVVHRLLLRAITLDSASAAAAAASALPAGRGSGVAIPASLVPSVLELAPIRQSASGTAEAAMGFAKLTLNPDGTRTYDKVAIAPHAAAAAIQAEAAPIAKPPAASSTALTTFSGFDDADEDGDALLDALLELDVGGSAGTGVVPASNPWLAGPGGNKLLLPSQRAEGQPASDEKVSGVASVAVAAPAAPLFSALELIRLCEHLNEQNRRAKRLSQRCQELFLRLYFARCGGETVRAVVCSLRSNGLLVYLPRFDVRAPVFLCDQDGTVQLEPALLGLPADAGIAPSLSSSKPSNALSNCRRFPGWSVKLSEAPAGSEGPSATSLTVSQPLGAKVKGRALTLRLLDVVTVLVRCEVDASQARLPRLQVQLTAAAPNSGRKGDKQALNDFVEENGEVVASGATVLSSRPANGSANGDSVKSKSTSVAAGLMAPIYAGSMAGETLYTVLERQRDAAIIASPGDSDWDKISKRRQQRPICEERVERGAGRMAFGGYQAPDSSLHRQLEEEEGLCALDEMDGVGQPEGAEASGYSRTSVRASLEDRRVQEYQREALARKQRLHAEKRHYTKPK